MFPTHFSAGPGEVAKAIEEMGFESFWVSEHSHLPTSTDFPGADSIPREYSSMLDPFVALAAAAAVTQRIRLGTAVCLIPQHDPFNCAKAIASLDQISNGRIELGIGAGWNKPEMENHGTDPATRFRLMRERVEAMKTLWSEEEAEYHGTLVDFDPVWQWPKPVQQPNPPILIAGAHPKVLERVARYGDGWLPLVVPEVSPGMEGRVTPLAELVEWVPRLNQLAADAGRPVPKITTSGLRPSAEALEILDGLGVERMVARVSSAAMADVQAELETLASDILAAGGQLQ
jgi:probable F420-dependent oxidoreductase